MTGLVHSVKLPASSRLEPCDRAVQRARAGTEASIVVRHAHRHDQRLTVSVAALVTFARVAEIVTSVGDFGRLVDTVNCPPVAPAGTVVLLGTVAILG